jgi:hypothetical protein
MVNWRSVAIGFAFLAALWVGFTLYINVIMYNIQPNNSETAILYHVQEISNNLVTLILLGAGIFSALLDIGDKLKRRS